MKKMPSLSKLRVSTRNILTGKKVSVKIKDFKDLKKDANVNEESENEI